MSREERIEAVRGWWEDFAREPITEQRARDPALDDFIAGHHDPDVVWDMSDYAGWPETPIYYGHAGVRRAIAIWSYTGQRLEFELEMVDAVGERVVSTAVQRTHRLSGGEPSSARVATVTALRDGKAVRVSVFSDLADALRAVGLPA
jgi:ketosteroid isomerase-like protein